MVACLLASGAVAETVSGLIRFPARSLPATVLYLRNVDSGALHPLALRRGETEFRIEAPPGRYWVFVRPDEPGLTGLWRAHAVQPLQPCQAGRRNNCLRGSRLPSPRATRCRDGRRGVDDWLLNDASAGEIDRILGNAPAVDSAELAGRDFRNIAARLDSATRSMSFDPRAAALASAVGSSRGGSTRGAVHLVARTAAIAAAGHQHRPVERRRVVPELLSRLSSDAVSRLARARVPRRQPVARADAP
jgi:hypothetical protein